MFAWQIGGGGGGGGGALSDAEKEQIVAAARTEVAVGALDTRFFEESHELKTGRPTDAARGFEDRARTSTVALYEHMAKGPDGLEDEAQNFGAGSPEHCEELRRNFNYVINERTSEKEYSNGIRDKGRNGARPSSFTSHPNAQEAGLTEAEVFSLRIYTTSVFQDMNCPLRDDERYEAHLPVPLPTVSILADKAIRKLRVVRTGGLQTVTVWRGLRNVHVSEAFMRKGGTELAFMSTTTDLHVAVRYALSRHSLIFKIVAPNFMTLGADLQWLSAFPTEAEVLFPPLTFLEPTGRTDRVEAVDRDGHHVTFTVIEVRPYI